MGDLREYYRTFLSIMSALSSVGRPAKDCQQEAEAIRRSTDALYALGWADGLEASAGDYVIWFGQRERYRAALRAFFREWDVLIAPANIVVAFPHTDEPSGERWLQVNDNRVSYEWQSFYPSLANLSGHPATAFPVGRTRSGLPLGLQAIGPYLEDRTPLRFAALVAQVFGGYRCPPGYDELAD
jgi:amidase